MRIRSSPPRVELWPQCEGCGGHYWLVDPLEVAAGVARRTGQPAPRGITRVCVDCRHQVLVKAQLDAARAWHVEQP